MPVVALSEKTIEGPSKGLNGQVNNYMIPKFHTFYTVHYTKLFKKNVPTDAPAVYFFSVLF
jgi:hypothetical protein